MNRPRPPTLSRLIHRLHGTAFAVLAALGAGQVHAQEEPAYTPDAALLLQVDHLARTSAAAVTASQAGQGGQGGPADAGSPAQSPRVDVKVGKLDPRLRLAPCLRIEAYLPPGLPIWGSTRMGLRCTQGTRPWNVSIPIVVAVYAQATVLRDALAAGTVLEASQLMQAEVDIAAAPGVAVADPMLAVGRTLSRNVPAGATLRQSDLKARQFFAAGETVRVTAIGAGWQVVTDGQAIGAGVEGQPVRVRTDSGRILTTRPTGDRQVEVSL